jgi:Uncharacterized protein conserved in bacteria (DUF2147)
MPAENGRGIHAAPIGCERGRSGGVGDGRLGRRREGEWARDDGKARVRFTSCGGEAICGAITWLRGPKTDPGKVGQEVFFGMKPQGDDVGTGSAFNPEDGKTYSGKMTPLGRPSDDRRLRSWRPHLQVDDLDPAALKRNYGDSPPTCRAQRKSDDAGKFVFRRGRVQDRSAAMSTVTSGMRTGVRAPWVIRADEA